MPTSETEGMHTPSIVTPHPVISDTLSFTLSAPEEETLSASASQRSGATSERPLLAFRSSSQLFTQPLLPFDDQEPADRSVGRSPSNSSLTARTMAEDSTKNSNYLLAPDLSPVSTHFYSLADDEVMSDLDLDIKDEQIEMKPWKQIGTEDEDTPTSVSTWSDF